MVGYKADGSRRYVFASGADERAARDALLAKAREWRGGDRAEQTDWTFAHFAAYWQRHHVGRGGVPPRESTWAGYAQALRCHIVPVLGRYRLDRLEPRHVLQLRTALLKRELSQSYRAYIDTVARMVLADAVRWGFLARDPSKTIERLTPGASRPRALAPAALRAFFAATEAYLDGHYAPLWTVTALSGCRISELCALTWRHVDLEAGVLEIVGAKSEAGVRQVALPPAAVEALRRQRRRQAEAQLRLGRDLWARRVGDRVFATTEAAPVTRSAAWRAFKKIAAAAGLGTGWTIKHLRSTYLTSLAAAGVHPSVAAAQAGHASPATTQKYYVAVDPEMRKRAASAAERLLLGAPDAAAR